MITYNELVDLVENIDTNAITQAISELASRIPAKKYAHHITMRSDGTNVNFTLIAPNATFENAQAVIDYIYSLGMENGQHILANGYYNSGGVISYIIGIQEIGSSSYLELEVMSTTGIVSSKQLYPASVLNFYDYVIEC